MYSQYKELIDRKGISSYRVSKDTGIPYSCLSDWKKGRSKPKIDKLILLSDYFKVPLDYFVEKKSK